MSHSVGSQQSVVPSGLPMLPGNGFKDPTKIDFKKTLTPFQKKDGETWRKNKSISDPVSQILAPSFHRR